MKRRLEWTALLHRISDLDFQVRAQQELLREIEGIMKRGLQGPNRRPGGRRAWAIAISAATLLFGIIQWTSRASAERRRDTVEIDLIDLRRVIAAITTLNVALDDLKALEGPSNNKKEFVQLNIAYSQALRIAIVGAFRQLGVEVSLPPHDGADPLTCQDDWDVEDNAPNYTQVGPFGVPSIAGEIDGAALRRTFRQEATALQERTERLYSLVLADMNSG